MNKKITPVLAAGLLLLLSLTGCVPGSTAQNDGANAIKQQTEGSKDTGQQDTAAAELNRQEQQLQENRQQEEPTSESTQESQEQTGSQDNGQKPKYVFLFIGDGMSYPQIQLANYYLNAKALEEDSAAVTIEGEQRNIISSENKLTMLQFETAGTAQTYNSTSFITDSAAAGTALASGHKTWKGYLNVSEDLSQTYETITEKLKKQKDFKIGILSTVNLNHATPAAFYAHQESRSNYYEIGLELIASGFDYFAGGALRQEKGKENNKTSLYDLAGQYGYQVVDTQAEAESLTAGSDKVIVIGEHLADSKSIPYEIDRSEDVWTLADYVEKGIEVLDNETGFFLMAEGGKIDWAAHANDAGTVLYDVLALDEAVKKAYEFYQEHPDETLIIVTGDHETGGLSLGYAGTGYDTYLTNFDQQKISFAKFNSDYIAAYREEQPEFDTVMKDITALFGLEAPPDSGEDTTIPKDSDDEHPDAGAEDSLVMTTAEYEQLRVAYENTLAKTNEEDTFDQDEYINYGSYEPLTVTITHILNEKSGISFSSYAHTALPVEVLAQGVGAELFEGYYDNTDIYQKLKDLLDLE